MSDLVSKLVEAGLSLNEAQLYAYVYHHPDCAVSDACNALTCSKSAIYRAFESLKEKKLILVVNSDWKYCLKAAPLRCLVEHLRRKNQQENKLFCYFQQIGGTCLCMNPSEILDEEQTYERYMELSEQKWECMYAFGNWEDFNHQHRNLVPLEKQFVQNRLKNGGHAKVTVTKNGPFTGEIIDYETQDQKENRVSKKSDFELKKPIWINAFEENDSVHIWSLNEEGQLYSNFLSSPNISSFFKNFVLSNINKEN